MAAAQGGRQVRSQVFAVRRIRRFSGSLFVRSSGSFWRELFPRFTRGEERRP
jgi:hypothetical protein